MSQPGVVTLKLIRSWTPIALSIGALGVAVFNFISDTQTRLTVLELTIDKTINGRLEQVEMKIDQNAQRIQELERGNP